MNLLDDYYPTTEEEVERQYTYEDYRRAIEDMEEEIYNQGNQHEKV